MCKIRDNINALFDHVYGYSDVHIGYCAVRNLPKVILSHGDYVRLVVTELQEYDRPGYFCTDTGYYLPLTTNTLVSDGNVFIK